MRLIDADQLKNEIDVWGCNDYDKFDFLEAIDNAPTVVPEDYKELLHKIVELLPILVSIINKVAKNNGGES